MLPEISGDLLVSEADVPAILATIRWTESRGDYTARASGASASGAYQYIDAAWGGFGGYAHAYLAPPEVQDAKAAADVRRILAANGNRAAAVFASWYWPRAVNDPAQLDVVPMPEAGNKMTVRAYTELQLGRLADTLTGRVSILPPPVDAAIDALGVGRDLAGKAAKTVVDAAGKVTVIGVLLLGGAALVVLGTRKAVQPS